MFILFFSGAKFSRDSETQLKKRKKLLGRHLKLKKPQEKLPIAHFLRKKLKITCPEHIFRLRK